MSLPAKIEQTALDLTATGGGLEGAERTSRELISWRPPFISPDMQINPSKEMADARTRDSVQNEGFALGAVSTHKDSIVGSEYRLNLQPAYEIFGKGKAFENWAEEYQLIVETMFNLISESRECWFDASRSQTLTGLVRLVVGGFMLSGEYLGTAEWLRDPIRPCKTAIQLTSPSRLSNPDGVADSDTLRRGIQMNMRGEALVYHIRATHPGDAFSATDQWKWIPVPARKPWGRKQVLYGNDPLQPEQTRGISDMVAVLKTMRMTKKFQEVVLQNAVVNASYAAAVESELPSEMVYASMGVGQQGLTNALGQYMDALETYAANANNIQVDGVRMPHLFPGTKLNLKSLATPGGIGTGFEESLHRHTAAALGISYEQYSKDFSKANYSSTRASIGETHKYMRSRKKVTADAFATDLFVLWLEEAINAGRVPLPPGYGPEIFYDPIYKEALCRCSWIGAGVGQIDEMKETQSAILRINNLLSTHEVECSRLGFDYRTVFKQRKREQRLMEELGIEQSGASEKPGANERQKLMKGEDDE